MIFLKGDSISELYPELLQSVLEEGEAVAPRGMHTLEVAPLGFELTDPRQSLVLQKARRLNYAYAIVERLSLVGGQADPDMLCFYIDKLWDYVNPESCCFDGAYGPRVRPQLDYVYEELQRDPASRRAVIAIYSEADQRESLDVPCSLALHFLIRQGKLDLMVNMRSSDLFLGLPYDVSQFAFLQQIVAGWLSLEPGRYIQWAHSGHIYGEQIERATRVVRDANDWLNIPGSVPKWGFNETWNQTNLFFELEREVRSGALQPVHLSDDPRFAGLTADLQNDLGEVAAYLRSKLARIGIAGQHTNLAHA